MKFIPFEKFTIKSNLNEIELKSLLSNIIEPKKYFRIKRNNKCPYEGTIKNNHFKINRIIYYKNPFLPIIKGKFIPQINNGTNIKITMRVNYFTFYFILFWSFGPTLMFLTSPPKSIIAPIVVSVIWIIIGFFFMLLGFNSERKKSKDFLINLFPNQKSEY